MAEETVAEGLQRLAALAEPLDAPDPGPQQAPAQAAADPAPDTGLDAAQQAAVRAVAGHGVSVLTGGPGTGKSRTVAAVVAMAAERGLNVALAAPTGRAAKRLEELTGAPATTVHRLLGAQGGGAGAADPGAAGLGPGRRPGRGR